MLELSINLIVKAAPQANTEIDDALAFVETSDKRIADLEARWMAHWGA